MSYLSRQRVLPSKAVTISTSMVISQIHLNFENKIQIFYSTNTVDSRYLKLAYLE